MSAKITLRRGFKAEAEKLAIKYRESLKIHPWAPLCAFKLAEHLQIPVYLATEFLEDSEYINLLSGANGVECRWSALTMTAKSGNQIIIHNPYHSVARQQSNLMHEVSHIVCKHEHGKHQYDFDIPFGMREFNEVQEEEAKCLGATLQLGRPCLLWATNKKMTTEEIAEMFNASTDMVRYRMNMTGVAKQLSFKRRS